MDIIERLFDALVVLQLTALFFFGITIVLKRWTAEPVERIRITITAFFAVFALFAIVMTPFVPRWSIAVWRESPTVSQEQPLIETTPPILAPHEIMSPTMTLVASDDKMTLQETPILDTAIEPAITTTSTETTPKPFHWWTLAKCCVTVGFLAMSIIMIVFYGVALFRLRRIMQNTSAAPEEIEQLFREQTANHQNTVRVRVSSQIDSPLMFGLFRSVILLPASMTLEENMTQIRYALAHEWAHHQHGDLATWGFVHFCRFLFWVQPFYWHLAKELRVDQDFLADNAASQSNITSNTEAEHYALVLLELAKRRIMSAAIGQSPALGFADTSPLLSRRIEMLLKEKDCLRRKSRWFWLLTTCGLFFGLTVILGSVRFTKTIAGEVQVENKTAVVAPSDDEKTIELKLLVIDDVEEKPVPGTTVKLVFGPTTRQWVTDTEGRIDVKVPAEIIDYQTEFLFYHREKGLQSWGALWDLPKDRKPTDPVEMTYRVYKARRVTGTVVDEDGKPVAGASVNCSWSHPFYLTQTDEQGHFELDASWVQPLESIYAFKPGVGTGIVSPDFPPNEVWKAMNRQYWDDWKKNRNDGPFTIKIEKGTPISVRVVDMEGNPIEGINVRPVYFSTEEFGWNAYGIEPYFTQKTDKNGDTTFDWMPTLTYRAILFEATGTDPRYDMESEASRYGKGQTGWRADKNDQDLVIQLPIKVRIDGSVKYEDGSLPNKGMQIHLVGKNYETVGINTDYDGKFTYFVNANEIISVCPIYNSRNDSKVGVAPAKLRVDVGDGSKPAPRFDFVLQKGTRLFGKLSNPKSYLQIYEMNGPEDDAIDNQNRRFAITETDEDGNYSVQLPPGLYRFQVEEREIPDSLKITDEEEIQKDF